MKCLDRTSCTPLLRLLVATILAVNTYPSLAPSPASAAASPSVASAPLALEEEEWEEEPDEWEVEDEEEEWVVEEDEGGWVVEEDEPDSGWEVAGERQGGDAPEPCAPYRANARVVAAERQDTVLLKVDYPGRRAKKVRVDYWLKGSRGALQLAPLRQRTSRRGSLRGVERLSARKMSKVRAARAFVVDLEMAGTPSYCDRYSTRHLTARQRRGDRMVWSEPARRAWRP